MNAIGCGAALALAKGTIDFARFPVSNMGKRNGRTLI
jgi:hypothetical protein